MLFVFNSITAQHIIKGRVVDTKTEVPLPGVSILIQNQNKGTSTDFEGYFTLSNIGISDFTIIVSYTGYIEKKISINIASINDFLEISLHEQVMELDEVILSTPFNKLQSDNVVRVSHKSLKSMQKNGTINLMDGISQIAGVSQMSTGSGISKPVIRGLTGNRVLVYNQGVKLENFQFGGKHGMGINESGISSVEVIKGPASLLYGSDALGGVIYLIPEKYAPKNEYKFNVKSQYTSNTIGHNSSFGIKKSFNKWQLLARVSGKAHADYQVPSSLRVTNSRFNNQDIKAGLGFIDKNFTSDIRYNYNSMQNGIPNTIKEQEISYKQTGTHQKINNHVLSIKNNITLRNSSIKTNIGYTNHRRTLIVKEIQKIGMQLNSLTFDAKWYVPKWKKLESIIGIQGLTKKNTNFGKHHLLPNARISNLGVFSTFNYEIDKLILQSGFRFDTRHINTTGTTDNLGIDKQLNSFTSSFGSKYDLMDQINLRLNIAGGFRAPNLSELASKGQHAGRIEIGNPDIKNEKNWQTDFAIEYRNSHLEFFINSFYNTIDNYIYLAPTGDFVDEIPVYQYNQNNAHLYGGEIGMHLHPHPLDWLHIESSFETVTGQMKANNSYLPLIPSNKLSNRIRLTKKTNKDQPKFYWNIGINHSFKTINIAKNEKKRPAYTLYNTSIGTELIIKKVHINTRLIVKNIFDKSYVSHLSTLREYEIDNMGRNILFNINLDF